LSGGSFIEHRTGFQNNNAAGYLISLAKAGTYVLGVLKRGNTDVRKKKDLKRASYATISTVWTKWTKIRFAGDQLWLRSNFSCHRPAIYLPSSKPVSHVDPSSASPFRTLCTRGLYVRAAALTHLRVCLYPLNFYKIYFLE
jgi:hypothetical protein